MPALELQDRLADLAPGESLLVWVAEVEQAFPYERTSEGCRAAATALAAWYQCSLAACGPDGSQILFTRHGPSARE